MFGGTFRDTITCTETGSQRFRDEGFLDIAVSVSEADNLESALAELTAPKTFAGEMALMNEEVGRKTDSTKRAQFGRLPPVMCFTLMRYEFDMETLQRYKLEKGFRFGERMDLAPFLAPALDPPPASAYELEGIVMHAGGAASGHYFTFFRDPLSRGDWVLFNDSSVQRGDEVNHQAQQAMAGQDPGEVADESKPGGDGEGEPGEGGDGEEAVLPFQGGRRTTRSLPTAYMLVYRRADTVAEGALPALSDGARRALRDCGPLLSWRFPPLPRDLGDTVAAEDAERTEREAREEAERARVEFRVKHIPSLRVLLAAAADDGATPMTTPEGEGEEEGEGEGEEESGSTPLAPTDESYVAVTADRREGLATAVARIMERVDSRLPALHAAGRARLRLWDAKRGVTTWALERWRDSEELGPALNAVRAFGTTIPVVVEALLQGEEFEEYDPLTCRVRVAALRAGAVDPALLPPRVRPGADLQRTLERALRVVKTLRVPGGWTLGKLRERVAAAIAAQGEEEGEEEQERSAPTSAGRLVLVRMDGGGVAVMRDDAGAVVDDHGVCDGEEVFACHPEEEALLVQLLEKRLNCIRVRFCSPDSKKFRHRVFMDRRATVGDLREAMSERLGAPPHSFDLERMSGGKADTSRATRAAAEHAAAGMEASGVHLSRSERRALRQGAKKRDLPHTKAKLPPQLQDDLRRICDVGITGDDATVRAVAVTSQAPREQEQAPTVRVTVRALPSSSPSVPVGGSWCPLTPGAPPSPPPLRVQASLYRLEGESMTPLTGASLPASATVADLKRTLLEANPEQLAAAAEGGKGAAKGATTPPWRYLRLRNRFGPRVTRVLCDDAAISDCGAKAGKGGKKKGKAGKRGGGGGPSAGELSLDVAVQTLHRVEQVTPDSVVVVLRQYPRMNPAAEVVAPGGATAGWLRRRAARLFKLREHGLMLGLARRTGEVEWLLGGPLTAEDKAATPLNAAPWQLRDGQEVLAATNTDAGAEAEDDDLCMDVLTGDEEEEEGEVTYTALRSGNASQREVGIRIVAQ